MSWTETDHMLPNMRSDLLERSMLGKIARILHSESTVLRPVSKHVSKRTGIAPDTIKKWKNGQNPPRLGHFLVLVKSYPEIFREIAILAGHEYIIPYIRISNFYEGADLAEKKRDPINDPIAVKAANLNERQLWFLGELESGLFVSVRDIRRRWHVSEKTAKRDIASLKALRLIVFAGPRKTGWYKICK